MGDFRKLAGPLANEARLSMEEPNNDFMPPLSDELLLVADEIAQQLGETEPRPIQQIRMIVGCLGPYTATKYTWRALKCHAGKGVPKVNGQKRTPGGIFFLMARSTMERDHPRAHDLVFPEMVLVRKRRIGLNIVRALIVCAGGSVQLPEQFKWLGKHAQKQAKRERAAALAVAKNAEPQTAVSAATSSPTVAEGKAAPSAPPKKKPRPTQERAASMPPAAKPAAAPAAAGASVEPPSKAKKPLASKPAAKVAPTMVQPPVVATAPAPVSPPRRRVVVELSELPKPRAKAKARAL